jgi:hypothetical protein
MEKSPGVSPAAEPQCAENVTAIIQRTRDVNVVGACDMCVKTLARSSIRLPRAPGAGELAVAATHACAEPDGRMLALSTPAAIPFPPPLLYSSPRSSCASPPPRTMRE